MANKAVNSDPPMAVKPVEGPTVKPEAKREEELEKKIRVIDDYWKERSSSYNELEDRHGKKFMPEEIDKEFSRVVTERLTWVVWRLERISPIEIESICKENLTHANTNVRCAAQWYLEEIAKGYPDRISPYADLIIQAVYKENLAHTDTLLRKSAQSLLMTIVEKFPAHADSVIQSVCKNLSHLSYLDSGQKLLTTIAERFPVHLDSVIQTVLKESLTHEEESARESAQELLTAFATKYTEKLSAHADSIIQTVLKESLTHKDSGVRESAQKLLIAFAAKYPDKISQHADSIIQTVCKENLFYEKSEPARESAQELLMAIAKKFPAHADSVIQSVCRESITRLDSSATRSLLETFVKEFPTHADSIIQAVIKESLTHKEGSIRDSAHELLRTFTYKLPDKIAPYADSIIQTVLKENLTHKDMFVRDSAQKLLRMFTYKLPDKIAPYADSVIQTVCKENFASWDGFVRGSAQELLKELARGSGERQKSIFDGTEIFLEDKETRRYAIESMLEITREYPGAIGNRWEIVGKIAPEFDVKDDAFAFKRALNLAAFIVPYRKGAPKGIKPLLERAAGEIVEWIESQLGRDLKEKEEALLNSPFLRYPFERERETRLFIEGTLPFLTHNQLKEEVFDAGKMLLSREKLLAYSNLNGRETMELVERLMPWANESKPVLRMFNELMRLKVGLEYGRLSPAQKEIFADEVIDAFAGALPNLKAGLQGKFKEISDLKGRSDEELRARVEQEFKVDVEKLKRQIVEKAEEAIKEARGKPGEPGIIAKQEGTRKKAGELARLQAERWADEGEKELQRLMKLRGEDPKPVEEALAQIDKFLKEADYVRNEGISFKFVSRSIDEFGMGKVTADCTAPGGINFWSVPSFLLDQGYQALQIPHNGELFCRFDLFLVEANGRLAIVVDALEAIPQSDGWDPGERDKIMATAVEKLKKVAAALDADLYSHTFSNRKWLSDYFTANFREEKLHIEKLGGLEQVRWAVRTLSKREVKPASYIQTMSLAAISEEEGRQLQEFERLLNEHRGRIGGLDAALRGMNYEAAEKLLQADADFWKTAEGIRLVSEKGVASCLKMLFEPSAMSADTKLRVILKQG